LVRISFTREKSATSIWPLAELDVSGRSHLNELHFQPFLAKEVSIQRDFGPEKSQLLAV
jgi:hypothetical protein